MNKIIKGKYLIDGNGGKPKENSAVIIENGKIKDITEDIAMFENRNKLGQFKKGKSGNPRGRPREGVGVPRVYLAYYKSEGKYISKIGISSNCSKRLRNIQYGSPEKLDFIKFNPTFYALNIEQKMLKEHKKNSFLNLIYL